MSIRVLLVEDNKADARLVKEALQDAQGSFELTTVDRLEKALVAIAEAPDLVLLDLSLPDSHGLATLARLRLAAPAVPLVILTGYEDEALALEAMRCGAQDYLVKGDVNASGLGRSIRYALERARAAATVADPQTFLSNIHRKLDVLDAEQSVLQRVGGKETAGGAALGGRYLLDALVGEGSHGQVYRASDTTLGRPVVVKILKGEGRRSATEARNFLKEARLAASLEHPNVVRIYDFGYEGDAAFLVMEHVSGGSLADRLSTAPVPATTALAWMEQVLHGLAYVHANGILHRDLKPANVLVSKDGVLKLTDFGLALTKEAAGAAGKADLRAKGTPAYVSPEGVQGKPLSPASDVYSAAAMLYQLLTARPYLRLDGRSAADLSHVIVHETPARPEVPEGIADVVMSALEKDPSRRPQSAGAFLDALRAAAREGPPRPSRARRGP